MNFAAGGKRGDSLRKGSSGARLAALGKKDSLSGFICVCGGVTIV